MGKPSIAVASPPRSSYNGKAKAAEVWTSDGFLFDPTEITRGAAYAADIMSFEEPWGNPRDGDAPARAPKTVHTPGPRHIRPDIEAFEVTLARIYAKDRGGKLSELALEASTQQDRKPSAYVAAFHQHIRAREEQQRHHSPVGMWGEYADGPNAAPTGYLCARHVSKPLGGTNYRRLSMMALDVYDLGLGVVCRACRESGR